MTDSSDRPLIAGVAGFAGSAALLFGFFAASFGCAAVVAVPTMLVLGWLVAKACVRYGRESWWVAALFGSILPLLFAGWVWTGRSEGQGLADLWSGLVVPLAIAAELWLAGLFEGGEERRTAKDRA